MSRLVDYFLVVGFDHEKQRGISSSGKVIQRFPEKDWPDAPFIDGIELFCQPQGWRLSRSQSNATFFTAVLTDVGADRHYCSCLRFQEPVAVQPAKHADDEELYMDGLEMIDDNYDAISESASNCMMFAPKCLVLVSQHLFTDTFRNCLGVIYTSYINESHYNVSLESMVGKLLASIKVPRGVCSDRIRFSLGVGDEHEIQPPLSSTVPVTGTSVYTMFEELGIHAVVTLFYAVMTEHKILFHSKSYTRLHHVCYALTSLMYPFKYSHVYIPILPASLLEVLCTPTPFVIGVHSSLKSEVADILDVIIVDLDGGCISVPDCVHIPRLEESADAELLTLLCMVIRPQLTHADDAFPVENVVPSPPHLLDKEIRAIFIRLFAQILSGYRSCLQTVRIHPKPFITFHKASFLGLRNLVESEFVVRLLDCMFFNSFIQERGLPFRPCDLFDELYPIMHEKLKEESFNPHIMIQNIKELSYELLRNEYPNGCENPTSSLKSFVVNNRSDETKIFPLLNPEIIQELIYSETIKSDLLVDDESMSQLNEPQSKLVPMGPTLYPMGSGGVSHSALVTNSARRLEVMKNCISCIFENKISDARKTFPAVLRALKNNYARLALAQELSIYVKGNRSSLSHEQFDLIVRLMNCSLQQDCDSLGGTASAVGGHGDVYGVASAMMPLAMAFCRKLCTHVIQFAYTCLQDHPIWNNLSFWESSFYQDVEKDIRSLYSGGRKSDRELPSGLEITAKQLQLIQDKRLSPSEIMDLAKNEEKTLFSQAVHFSNRIVALKIPLDVGHQERLSRTHHALNASGENHNHSGHPHHQSDSNSYVTGAVGNRERDEREENEESGFEEDKSGSHGKGLGAASGEISASCIKFTARFVDKVSTEGELSEEEIKNLHQMVPVLVAMQVENLDPVFKESRKLPPVSKPKIVAPHLLPGEELALHGLRVFLMPDGRDDNYAHMSSGTNNVNSGAGTGPVLLPAEGAIFLTNYRIIFRGIPCDPFYSECPVVRSFPVATLTKEKRITFPSDFAISSIDHSIQEGLQIRSNSFQLLRIAYDEEVTTDTIEMFRKMINKHRSPSDIFPLFAFTSQTATSAQMNYLNAQKMHKDKNSTLRGVAKKTLLRTAGRVGIPVKQKTKGHKYLLPPIPASGSPARSTSSRNYALPDNFDEKSIEDVSISSETTVASHHSSTLPQNHSTSPTSVQANPSFREKDVRTIRKLAELSYVKDYCRLGLGSARDILSYNNSSVSSSSSHNLLRNSGMPRSSSFTCDSFRISSVNCNYSLIQTYPCFMTVPHVITDESIKKLCKGYRHSRFPLIVWRHPIKKGLFLRGSSFHGKGVIGMLRGHGTSATAGAASASSESVNLEQERYFRSIIQLTPSNFIRKNAHLYSSSSPEKSSMIAGFNPVENDWINRMNQNNSSDALPPDTPRKHFPYGSSIYKAMNTLRNSGGKGTSGFGKQFQKLTGGGSSPSHQQIVTPESSSYAPHPSSSSDKKMIQGSVNSGLDLDQRSVSSVSSSTIGINSNRTSGINLPSDDASKSSLIILGEKSQMKGIKSDHHFQNCSFIPLDIHEVKHVKASFKKLLRACCPSVPTTDPDLSFYKQIRSSEWFSQMQTVMQISSMIVDHMDSNGSSVMICLEDGWDLVPQITSIAELSLDPYYRTFEGFKILIEKEWLAFGHRFSHRSNHTAATLTSGFAPIFLQFLDMVHQIMDQYPLSFEFNNYYLKFMAYHYVSCRFRTFLLDSESERSELGWLLEDAKRKIPGFEDDFSSFEDHESSAASNTQSSSGVSSKTSTSGATGFNYIGTSFWDFAERIWAKSPIFYNFLYVPTNLHESDQVSVLTPTCHLARLNVWDYFCEENLATGFSYDLELVQMENQRREETEATEQKSGNMQQNKRKVCSEAYDSVHHQQPNSISILLEDLRKVEREHLGTTQKWSTTWGKVEIPMLSTTGLSSASVNTNSSLRLDCLSYNSPYGLMSGHNKNKLLNLRYSQLTDAGSNQFVYSHRPHRFDRYAFSKPCNCDYCKNVLWGITKTGLKCSDCGYNCHEKCSDQVPQNCQGFRGGSRKYSATPEGSVSRNHRPFENQNTTNTNGQDEVSSGQILNGNRNDSDDKTLTNADLEVNKRRPIQHSDTYYGDHFKDSKENITYQGYLNKKGALLKSWKQRWFVLDSIKHQLRYYDSQSDTECKGFIDLAEVVGAYLSAPGTTHVELKTIKRSYSFMAVDTQQAQEWVEKIQASLQ